MLKYNGFSDCAVYIQRVGKRFNPGVERLSPRCQNNLSAVCDYDRNNYNFAVSAGHFEALSRYMNNRNGNVL